MTALTGANTDLILKLGSTFATAVQGGAGDKMTVRGFNRGLSPEVLRAAAIGSGLSMDNDAARGSETSRPTFTKDLWYDGPGNAATTQFFGGESLMNMGSGGYMHSWMFNATANLLYATIAARMHSSAAMEYASAAITKLGYGVKTNNYIEQSIEALANDEISTGTVNTAASLLAATLPTVTKKVVPRAADYFLLNAQAGGALSTSTDAVGILEANVSFDRSQDPAFEIRGASGIGGFIDAGDPPFVASLDILLKNLVDFTYFTAADSATEYKAAIQVQGDLIGGSIYYKYIINFPRLIIVEDIDYGLQNPGFNQPRIKFKPLVASSVPAGMWDIYPHVGVINTKSTLYRTVT